MICNCCYEDLPWRAFSNSAKRVSAKCKECNMYLRQFAAYLGPTRDWEANRKKAAERKRAWRATQPPKVKKPKPPKVKAHKPVPIKERATYVYAYRTILANAPWPYRRTAGVCGVSV